MRHCTNCSKPILRQAAAIPLPKDFPETEIGLMTAEEFLEFRNPGDKFHANDAYDFTLKTLNSRMNINRLSDKYNLYTPYDGEGHVITNKENEAVVAVIHKGTLYLKHGLSERQIPTVASFRGRTETFDIQRTKTVKYPAEYVRLVSDVANRTYRQAPHLLQNIIVKGQPFQVRSEGPPQKDKGTTINIVNSMGEIVAAAQDEWGATLIAVVQEYRGLGLGPILGEFWYEHNPSYKSGGFTSSGKENALRIWEKRVREFLARGWYSELVRTKRLTSNNLENILAGLRTRPNLSKLPELPKEKAKAELLVYAQDSAFVLYDARFLDEEEGNEDYILGHGFFRSADPVGTFLYTLDYERPYHKYVTAIALQMAKDEGDEIYVGQGYGDMLELDGIQGVSQEGDYVTLSRDLLPLKALASKERRLRRSKDPYDQMMATLLETAESKWR